MTILITGTNRGIGAELRARYLAAGQSVIGTARGAAPEGGVVLDVTDPASIAGLSSHLDGAPLDLLVCNAGVYLDKGADLDTGFGADLWAQTFAANVSGVFLTIQTLLPNLAAAGGKIAIISSKMGSSTLAPGGSYIYRASKAAALNLGRNLASDLKPRGLAVGIYHPGWVKTDMGGGGADLTIEASAHGLIARFEALSLDTTGVFETYDGQAIPL
ncbi:MAG: SDR family NAD(P)-dependent oxidoreductase [Rhodobacteraceae bacterium]|nr:SDR family NAD(P)-dependent oxidoreductase [Paracoccaceae bacterium]